MQWRKFKWLLGISKGMVVEACWDSRHNTVEVQMHIGYSVAEIVAATDCINWCG